MNKLMTLARRRRVIPALRSGVDYSLGGLDPELVGGFADGYYSAGGARTTFADLFTFNRASTATYFDVNGNLQTAAIGEARLDHDPATGSPLGLLVEPQRKNVWQSTNPVDFSPSIISQGCTWTKQATGVEDGIPYADYRVTGTFSNTFTDASNLGTGDNRSLAAEGDAWSGSIWFKLLDTTTPNGAFLLALVEEATGQAYQGQTSVQLGTSPTWQRVSGTHIMGAGTVTTRMALVLGGATNGQPVDMTIRVGLPQYEEGDYPTSPIPTAGSTVTRTADDCSVALSKFAFNTVEGSVVVDFDVRTTGQASLFTISNGATNNRLRVNSSSSGVLRSVVTSGGVTTYALNGASNLSDISKVAYGFKEQDYALYADGVSEITSSATGSMPSGLTTLQVGASSVGAEVMVGHIKLLRYFPTRLSDATLQEGST